ncbi:MAG: hypothetical protein H6613_06660 [Ignavibacteriales bacterium]|nr:hypothetical protein [Ignavibacteriales bacterium]
MILKTDLLILFLQINDEGAAGSLTLPSLFHQLLLQPVNFIIWVAFYIGEQTALGSSGSAGGWTNTTGKIFQYYTYRSSWNWD